MINAEKAFADEIDCRFPYDDLDRRRRLIDRGIAISPNAAFRVLEEICRPPHGKHIPEGRLEELLAYWRSRCTHPAAVIVADVAASMIGGRGLSVDEAIARINTLAEYAGLYAALSILYFSCDDAEERLEPINAAIREGWAVSLGIR